MLYTIFTPGDSPSYVAPNLTVTPAKVLGLSAYQFNTSNRAIVRNTIEMMHIKATPPLAIPQGYMARGLVSQQTLGAGRGVLPTIIVTGRV